MKTSTLLLPLYPLLGLAATIKNREPAANAAVDVVTYHPYTPGGRTQYCGDTAVFKVTTMANSPLVADCSALAKHFVPILGYYTLDIPANDDGIKWHPVASLGTCTFAIRTKTEAAAIKLDVGTNDISYQTGSALYLAKDGKLEVGGGVWCFAKGRHQGVDWKLIKTEK
ncbi:hypothetical protein B0T11DRAFT_351771 [Plectosphaerella cucumerina]|uniref:Ecp2 effector protein-like domain-containing protein n=1 Tax=Plectosphaerella cucumerina TaxID=40658 RepID=A0A8K0TKG4_9PEZI|nr:hypothetical protein B0T11DRAFT_351771 [Plectosphaerella cucumerina]